MRDAIPLKYKFKGRCDVGLHSDRLTLTQQKNGLITTFLNTALPSDTRMKASNGPTRMTTLGDIVILKTMPVPAVERKTYALLSITT